MIRMQCLRGVQPRFAAYRTYTIRATLTPLAAALLCAGSAWAQLLPSPTPQFDITGFIQAASLDPTMCPGQPEPFLKGGTVTVNGIKMVVPCNTIVQMPANTIPWAFLFPVSDASGNIVGSAAVPVGPAGAITTAALNGQPATVTTDASGAVTSVVGGAQAPGQTGLALADSTTAAGLPATTGPFPSFETRVIGNIVQLPDAAGVLHDTYVVGLVVPVTQQGANLGFGQITCIDYANGFLVVGGDAKVAPNPTCTLPSGAPNGVRIQINDPIARWGNAHSPDPRFQADTQNTTIHSASGYPMCVPRVPPTSVGTGDGGDPLCPAGNRPLNGSRSTEIDPAAPATLLFPVDPFLPIGAALKVFTMPPPPLPIEASPAVPPTPAVNCPQVAGGPPCIPATPGSPTIPAAAPVYPDSRFQVPFMVGDFIDYQGTIAKDTLGNTYVSAHTIIDHVGIFTASGTQPAYVNVEVILIGTAGTPPPGNLAIEATQRIFVVGFTTDPTNFVDVNAVDVDPCTGEEKLRLLGTVDPRSQVLRGRFRFHVLGGKFMPPTREMIIQTQVGQTQATEPFDPTMPGLIVGVANGLGSGQFRLPNFDFIVPENLKLGDPITLANFEDFPFLAQGSGPLFGAAGNAIIGQLDPWPGRVAPPKATCVTANGVTGAAPIASAGFDFAINTTSAAVEPIAGSVTQSFNADPATTVVQWTQISGPTVTLINANTLNPSFSVVDPVSGAVAPSAGAALGVGAVLQFQLTVSDTFGTSSSTATVTVLPTTDTIPTSSATFRTPKPFGLKNFNRVGGSAKGGRLGVLSTDSLTSVSVSMIVPGWGRMEEDAIRFLPNYFLDIRGTTPPQSVDIRTNLGAEALGVPVLIR